MLYVPNHVLDIHFPQIIIDLYSNLAGLALLLTHFMDKKVEAHNGYRVFPRTQS